jgi:hypothetical protein
VNKSKIEKCERLCREFLERAKVMCADTKAITYIDSGFGSKESGALRRTSMELTRALAELRRAG